METWWVRTWCTGFVSSKRFWVSTHNGESWVTSHLSSLHERLPNPRSFQTETSRLPGNANRNQLEKVKHVHLITTLGWAELCVFSQRRRNTEP